MGTVFEAKKPTAALPATEQLIRNQRKGRLCSKFNVLGCFARLADRVQSPVKESSSRGVEQSRPELHLAFLLAHKGPFIPAFLGRYLGAYSVVALAGADVDD
jgi:hypothetical protein